MTHYSAQLVGCQTCDRKVTGLNPTIGVVSMSKTLHPHVNGAP